MKKVLVLALLCSFLLSACQTKRTIIIIDDESSMSESSENSDNSSQSETSAITTTNSTTTPAPVTSTLESSDSSDINSSNSSSDSENWKETVFQSKMYVISDCYSREKAIVGAETVDLHFSGEMVVVVAKTDTDYYKLEDGNFIHIDYLTEQAPETDDSSVTTTNPADFTTAITTTTNHTPGTTVTTTSKHNNETSKPEPDDKVEYINGVPYVNSTIVVNRNYSLPTDYAPGVNATANSALEEMIETAAAENLYLSVISDFRTYSDQKAIYNSASYYAAPGHSEHQTGLAFDLNSFDSSFGSSPEGEWVAKNCYKYGFIIRYPKGKESITGYQYEPWHIRYVGLEASNRIHMSGLCLEEYLGLA